MTTAPGKDELRALCQQGRFAEARTLAASLCRAMPVDPECWFLAAAIHGELGEYADAERCCREALAFAPGQGALLYNLGVALGKQGKHAEAEQALRQAVAAGVGGPDVAAALADTILGQGQVEQAIGLYRDILAGVPGHLHAVCNLARACRLTGRVEAAVRYYREATTLNPAGVETWIDWAGLLIEQGALPAALATVRAALSANPGNADLNYQHAYVLSEMNRHEEALAGFDACLAADPEHVEARFARASILKFAGRISAAEADLVTLLERDESNSRAHAALAGLYLSAGASGQARQHVERAVKLAPDDGELQHNRLMNMHYWTDMTAADVFQAHREWGVRFGQPAALRTAHVNEAVPGRRLRIGYVSGDFRGHSVARFIESVLVNHDRTAFLVVCYSNLHPEQHDDTTHRLQAVADVWRDVAMLNDADLADLVAADGIDVLVDLSGHTSGNRLGAFALQPAPVQVTWLGYPDTTGLPAMQYRLTDDRADPAGAADALATETLLRLPHGFLCFSAPQHAPECGTPPCTQAGYVTFGSLNNLAKVNDTVVASWARILAAVPGSRLLLKAAAFADDATREAFAGRFARHGIDAGRLELISFKSETYDHLACYRAVDIALDTWPYNGTTTTCEALWMGVPVITLAGQCHAGRVGESLLERPGLAEFVAASVEAYERCAVMLAQDTARLADLRATLRARLQASSLMDGKGFCRALEHALRVAWQDWCDRDGVDDGA